MLIVSSSALPCVPRPAKRPRVLLRLAVLAGVAPLWVCTPAQAVVDLALQLDSSWASESNPLRLPVGSSPQELLKRDATSDSILSVDARLAMVAPLLSDRTRLEITAGAGRRDYSQMPQLNHRPQQLDARLVWEGDRWLKGRLGYRTDQTLYQPLNAVLVSRDVLTQRVTSSEVAVRVTPDLDLPLGFDRSSLRHESAVNQFLDRNETGTQLALRYTSTLGSVFTAGARYSDVDYPHRGAADVASLDERYSDRQRFVDMTWVYSPFTTAALRLNWLDRSYNTLQQSDFQHLLGHARVAYQYSPKTRFDVEWVRQIYDSTTPNVLYYLSTAMRASVGWRFSEFTRFRLIGSHEQQQNRPGFNAAAGLPDTHINRLGGSIDYSVAPGWRLYADGLRDRLTTVGGGSTVRNNVLRVGLEYTYENVAGAADRGRLNRRP